MNKACASGWLRGYMEILQMDLEEVSEEINIPVARLVMDCKEPFWADEFLNLCAYLNVDVDRLIKSNREYEGEDEEYYENPNAKEDDSDEEDFE